MDSEEWQHELIEEIEEISQLIEKWASSTDPDSLWAIQLLERCLERRMRMYRRLLH
jgi:hypothetical protein